MKNKLLFLALLPTFLFSLSAAQAQFPAGKDDIVILFENDVHGAVEGYPVLADMQDLMDGA